MANEPNRPDQKRDMPGQQERRPGGTDPSRDPNRDPSRRQP